MAEWTCGTCTFINESHALACAMCTTPRPVSEPAQAPAPHVPHGTMEVTLHCPADKGPGQVIQVRHPHTDQVFQVAVPAGTTPGTSFKALMPKGQRQQSGHASSEHRCGSHVDDVQIARIPKQQEKSVVLKSIERLNASSGEDHDLLQLIMQMLNGVGKLRLVPSDKNTRADGNTVAISGAAANALIGASGGTVSSGGSTGRRADSNQDNVKDNLNSWWGGGIANNTGSGAGQGQSSDGADAGKTQGGSGGGGPIPSNPHNVATQGAHVNSGGQILGAQTDFAQDYGVQTPNSQDSGTYYREKDWQALIKQPGRAEGPKQVGLDEVVSLTDRSAQQQRQREQEARRAKAQVKLTVRSKGTNVRVNPLSKQRGYSMEGYEHECYIDPGRSLDETVGAPGNAGAGGAGTKAAQVASTEASGAAAVAAGALMFESCAMGAKLRNTHKMGGERVKSMDHFVASVETPNETLVIPDIVDLTGGGGAIALTDATVQSALKACEAVPLHVRVRDGAVSVNGGHSRVVDVPFFVANRFVAKGGRGGRDRGGGGTGRGKSGAPTATCDVHIRSYAHLLYQMLHVIYSNLLQEPAHLSKVHLFYMTTMRANSSVAQVSKKNGGHYYNAMVLQQMQCCEGKGLEDEQSIGEIFLFASMSEKEKKRVWLYWLQRASMQLPRERGGATGAFAGLYDPGVRSRFRAFAARGFVAEGAEKENARGVVLAASLATDTVGVDVPWVLVHDMGGNVVARARGISLGDERAIRAAIEEQAGMVGFHLVVT